MNPAKLEASQRDSVCSRCHLSGATRIDADQRIAAFRPGQILDNYAAFFVPIDIAASDMKATGHMEMLAK